MAATRPASSSLWGRATDYLLGRNTLIGVASIMLLLIAGFATWHGMRDFIIGVSTSPAASAQELPGGLSFSNDFLVIIVVVALTFLMWLMLRETFAQGRRFTDRLVTFPLYVFLAIWSIGFGYGFWWSLIAGEEATRTGLAGLQQDAGDAASAVAARLDAVKVGLDGVVTWSESQMSREETSGGSCGTSSGAGRGPLYNARVGVRDQIASLRDGVQNSWIAPVQADITSLQKSVASLEGATVAERQASFNAMASNIRSRARDIATRSNELGKSTATEMRAIAAAVSVPPGQSGFSCYDPTLAQRLTQAAVQADQPAVLELREAAFNEGPAGVANAIKRLWENIGTYLSSLVGYVSGEAPEATTKTGQPITGRDMIALLATIGIDLGLLALAILNPPPPESKRPSSQVTRQIRAAINTAIERAPGATLEWVRRHFIYHKESSYLVIPNLYSCDPKNEEECARALAMNQLAGVLDDLNLVRWPQRARWWKFQTGELDKLKAEESQASQTDLTDIRKQWIEKRGGEKSEDDIAFEKAQPIRNHGLFSKAEKALTFAGWSERARRDMEIFPLEDVEGLTPILMVLADDGTFKAEEEAQAKAAAAKKSWFSLGREAKSA
ncbi:MAG: hypothetical protein K8F92_05615 [Hyphomicrobium sp.]|uniref:hypothetical protein n=1 Tax=Hyphomicrobium sp. TaxID=82 RepID=UPI0025B9DFFA|nr:hypothetical protein [Hyphomicrobium sp.]MBZ0209115.1 hypothetical protein [Hyphomicrobium sp.]